MQTDSDMDANLFNESAESEDEVHPPTPLPFTHLHQYMAMTYWVLQYGTE